MSDDSELDGARFIDENFHNCPFCRRNHLPYYLVTCVTMDWSTSEQRSVFYVRCGHCNKVSQHIARKGTIKFHRHNNPVSTYWTVPDGAVIDDLILLNVPSSTLVLDQRIPKKFRELVGEAQGSIASNFLTGASACVRKIIYELAAAHGAVGDDSEERVKSLKSKFSDIDPTFFDTLVSVQQMTSTKVHEESYDGWKSAHLRVMLEAIRTVLDAIYVEPEKRKRQRERMLRMQKELMPKGTSRPPGGTKKSDPDGAAEQPSLD